jgi:hypothetical protein
MATVTGLDCRFSRAKAVFVWLSRTTGATASVDERVTGIRTTEVRIPRL